MTVFAKKNIIIPGPGGQKFRLNKGCITPVPEWAEKSAYLAALAKDGKVIISQPKPQKKPEGKPGGGQ